MTQSPTRKLLTVPLLLTEQVLLSLTVKLTSEPEVAVALTVKFSSPYFLVVGVPVAKLIVWLALLASTVRVMSAAAL